MALQRRRRRRADEPLRPQWGGLCPRLNTVSSSDVAFDYRENQALVSPHSRLGENFCRPLLASSSRPYLGFLWKANKPAGTLADVVVIESSKTFYLLFFLNAQIKRWGGFFGQVDYKSMSIDVRFRRMSCNNINPINMNRK